jgi:hypothetical protein
MNRTGLLKKRNQQGHPLQKERTVFSDFTPWRHKALPTITGVKPVKIQVVYRCACKV